MKLPILGVGTDHYLLDEVHRVNPNMDTAFVPVASSVGAFAHGTDNDGPDLFFHVQNPIFCVGTVPRGSVAFRQIRRKDILRWR